MTKTDVAVTRDTSMVSAELMDDILAGAGEGTDFLQSELVLPFVRIAQSLSPQINPRKPEHIPGLQLGWAYNTVTQQFWPQGTGLQFVIAYQRTALLTFTPRAAGGGFRGEIQPDDRRLLDIRVGSRNEELLPDGLELVRSDQHYGLVVAEDGFYQPAVIDMKSTQLKVSRRLKTQISLLRVPHPKSKANLIKPPVYASVWHFDTCEESNEKGDFFNWSFSHAGYVQSRQVFDEAKLFREACLAGRVSTAPEAHDDMTPAGATAGRSGAQDEEIPF
jgi:hypothetical protein